MRLYAHWSYQAAGGGATHSGSSYLPPTVTYAQAVSNGDQTAAGGNTITIPLNQGPIKNPDGSTTLPGGGTITTQGGTSFDVSAGTVINSAGNVITLPNGSAGGVITQGNAAVNISPGMTVTITDGAVDPDITYREMWHIGIRDQVILNYVYQFIKKEYYENSCKYECYFCTEVVFDSP